MNTRRDPFAMTRWQPFRELQDLLQDYSPLSSSEKGPVWQPVAEISETDREYIIQAQLPDVSKEDIDLTFEDGVLSLRGERRCEMKERENARLRIESFYGTFSRSFSLPTNIDEKRISAESKDGVLRICLPKTDAHKSKPVSVQVR